MDSSRRWVSTGRHGTKVNSVRSSAWHSDQHHRAPVNAADLTIFAERLVGQARLDGKSLGHGAHLPFPQGIEQAACDDDLLASAPGQALVFQVSRAGLQGFMYFAAESVFRQPLAAINQLAVQPGRSGRVDLLRHGQMRAHGDVDAVAHF